MPPVNMPVLTYLLLAAVFPCAAVNLPLFSVAFEGSPQSAALFLAGLPGALLAIAWPRLRPTHALLLPLFVALFAPLGTVAFTSLVAPVSEPVERALWTIRLSDYWTDHPVAHGWRIAPWIQTAVSVVTAVGLWMRWRNQGILIRLSADDREEIEQLFELSQSLGLPRPLSLYRLQRLIESSRSLTAEYRGRRLGLLPVFQWKGELVFVDPIAPTAALRVALVESFLRRMEVGLADGLTAALRDAADLQEPLAEAGFGILTGADHDLDHILSVRKFLEELASVRLDDPEFFADNRTFLRRLSPDPNFRETEPT